MQEATRKQEDLSQTLSPPAKKPYTPPHLQTHGNVHDLTKGLGPGTVDGQTGSIP